MSISGEYALDEKDLKAETKPQPLERITARLAHTASSVYRIVTKRQHALQVIPRVSAREIMGTNFFGVEEWAIRLGIKFSDETIHKIADFPWNGEILESSCLFIPQRKVRETHFAFLGLESANSLPLNLMWWQKICEARDSPGFSKARDQHWYKNEAFAQKETCKLRWYLMPILSPAIFRGNTFEKQVEMRPREYETPLLIEEVTKLLLWHNKSAIPLYHPRYSRIQNFDHEGKRAMVRITEDDGIDIISKWDNTAHQVIGIALSRKMCM